MTNDVAQYVMFLFGMAVGALFTLIVLAAFGSIT